MKSITALKSVSTLTNITNGDIGEPFRKIELEPLPETEPISEPSVEPSKEPEKVDA